jgi:glutamyl-tRNA synthetase
VLTVLDELMADFGSLTEWSAGSVHACLSALGERHGLALGKIAQPIRLAVSGGTVSPPIDQTLAILGREETLKRLERARSRWQGSLAA